MQMNTYYEKMDSVPKQTKRRSIESKVELKLEMNETVDHGEMNEMIDDEKFPHQA